MNSWNIVAIVFMTIFGILYAIRNRTTTYQYDQEGIRNLNERKDIASSTITNVNLNDELIAIDTTKYRNELTIKAVNLKYQTWNKLTSELAELNKTWANN